MSKLGSRLIESLKEALAHAQGEPTGVARSRSKPEPLLDSVDNAAIRLGVGRTRIYELMASGQLRSVKLGKRRLIPRDAQLELVASLSNDRRIR